MVGVPTVSNAESLFRRALVSEDEAYLVNEARLVEAVATGAALPPVDGADVEARLLAEVVASWSENEDAFRGAEQFMAEVEEGLSDTILVRPRVKVVVDGLVHLFGDRLRSFFALRLARTPGAPVWRLHAAVAYLERHPLPDATEPLIRLAVAAPSPTLQDAVARALRASGDPALRSRLASAGRNLPPALAALAS
jgi:hypothetical protein